MGSGRELARLREAGIDTSSQPAYIVPRGQRQTGLQESPPPKSMKLGILARLRYGKEINEHILTLLRNEHLAIEAHAAQEAVAVTLLSNGRIRLQVAHRAGEWVKEYGPDSAAHIIAPLIAAEIHDETEDALRDIAETYRNAVKRNLQRW